jgi:enediyne polyketide synthase
MGQVIAVVGMACRYPEANSPEELWQNALAGRRAFRRIPAVRLNLDDYHSADRRTPDRTYSTEGAFIEGYEFDRVRFRVPSGAYRAADPAHWLALDVATAALADAGCDAPDELPRETTGVFIGNTLTGEFSRANTLRLRWPYVRRVLQSVLDEEDALSAGRRRAVLERVEELYKRPFPPVGEETLAGGLSNTIAGRICNHFDLHGGGYTLDGACASSLLAVANACAALASGDLDAALAGGVDLSTDPFELIGFAKTGALAEDSMRVYDARAQGFWPGEGCGVVLLMRHEDALARGLTPYALIRGWGVSSDGSGGITRPEVEGQLRALRRAYARAGYHAETVAYFEGHGTGTALGDATEIRALTRARCESRESANGAKPLRAALSSVKAIIGHTKAAAGVAGLIKASMALHTQVLPPAVGCDEPHAELKSDSATLRVLRRGELFPPGAHLRAGVSAMGFGGINTHLTLEAAAAARRLALNRTERALVRSAQDAELFLLGARDIEGLLALVERLLTYAALLSRGELTDLAARLAETLDRPRVRAAVVASEPAELEAKLQALKTRLRAGAPSFTDARAGLFFNDKPCAPRVGFLFPGQGSPAHADGGAWRRRFEFVEDLYAPAGDEWGGDGVATEVAQPAIVTASLAALRALARLGIEARVAVGHSLGELTALHWAGAFDEETLRRVARGRGRAMAGVGGPPGAMLSVGAGRAEVEEILNGDGVSIAGLNSPTQTILSGEARAVARVRTRCEARGLRCTPLRVSHAFHSPLVAAAAPALSACLGREEFGPLRRAVVSTVTGRPLAADEDLRPLLLEQLTSPVRFAEAVCAAGAEGIDLWLEVGPGHTLSALATETAGATAVALDAGGPSLRGLLSAAAACFVAGARVEHAELFAGRLTRPFDLDWRPRFFVNPCELAPADGGPQRDEEVDEEVTDTTLSSGELLSAEADSPLEVLRRLLAERAELPASAVKDDSRLLDDLHLNSITVAQLVAEAARHLRRRPPADPTIYANATLAEAAEALSCAASETEADATREEGEQVPGVAAWVAEFSVELVERARPRREPPAGVGEWRVLGPHGDAFTAALREAFARAGAGRGIVVALPNGADEARVPLLLEGARAALAGGADFRFVLAQHEGAGPAFARTLHLEAKNLTTCVVEVPRGHGEAAAWVTAEALAARGYVEAHYDDEGRRRVPVLRPLAPATDAPESPLTRDDVLLVTGGARGITAECALALVRETGARLALFGRSAADGDEEVVANLARLKAAGAGARYYRVDVTDEAATRAAVRRVEEDFGKVTALLHGAARNVPRLIKHLDAEAVSQTLAPKVRGARNLLAALDPEHLRLFIGFGSIIARTGLPGEADYGLANEWLTRLTAEWQAAHPHCRGLAVEWSVWSGVGMGARLDAVDGLTRRGVSPISTEQGVAALRRLLGRGAAAGAAVVMGRGGDLPTLAVERPELPLLRFLEKPRVYYPKIELVADAELSGETDPYLDDHAFGGERLLPAVLGLEAMAQAVMALAEVSEPPAFERVRFERPVVIPVGASLTVRVAALARGAGSFDVVLRSSQTDFQVEHFRATCRLHEAVEAGTHAPLGAESGRVPLEPGRDLYGKILFHGGRFRRLGGYRALAATGCLAEIVPDGATRWFGPYLPDELVLGDPGARDAALHAVQACVPHLTLLPAGVERVTASRRGADGPVSVRAREREQLPDGFVYDLELADAAGRVCERWEGLRLRAVGGAEFKGAWPAGLLAPYVERRVRELLPGAALSVAFERDAAAQRRTRGARAVERAVGAGAHALRRTDGKPETLDGRGVSAAHCGDLTLAVAGPPVVGCDLESIVERPAQVWRDLLGGERFRLAQLVGREAGESLDTAATRVWAAGECLKKSGAGAAAPLIFTASRGGWVLLASGGVGVASGAVALEGRDGRLVIAVAAEGPDARV